MVRILEKIEKIIEERQQTLVDLDMLVKSRFVLSEIVFDSYSTRYSLTSVYIQERIALN